MKKYLAHIITGCRLAAAPYLLGCAGLSRGFMAVFIFCGLTDVADGAAARRLGTESRLGAGLDTLADLLVYAALFRLLLLRGLLPGWFTWWLAACLALQAAAAAAEALKSGSFLFRHTLSSKVMGLALFALAFVIGSPLFRPYLLGLGLIFSWSALEAALWQAPSLREEGEFSHAE